MTKKNTTDLQGNPGWSLKFFEQGKTEPHTIKHNYENSMFSPLGGMASQWNDLELSATFVPEETGSHYLGCSGLGPTKVFINDELVFEQSDNCSDAMAFLFGGVPEPEFTYPFARGEAYRIRIRTIPSTASDDAAAGILAGRPGFRLGLMHASEHDADLLSEAVHVARTCDAAIVFTGHTPVWETEGQDQASFQLPKSRSCPSTGAWPLFTQSSASSGVSSTSSIVRISWPSRTISPPSSCSWSWKCS